MGCRALAGARHQPRPVHLPARKLIKGVNGQPASGCGFRSGGLRGSPPGAGAVKLRWRRCGDNADGAEAACDVPPGRPLIASGVSARSTRRRQFRRRNDDRGPAGGTTTGGAAGGTACGKDSTVAGGHRRRDCRYPEWGSAPGTDRAAFNHNEHRWPAVVAAPRFGTSHGSVFRGKPSVDTSPGDGPLRRLAGHRRRCGRNRRRSGGQSRAVCSPTAAMSQARTEPPPIGLLIGWCHVP